MFNKRQADSPLLLFKSFASLINRTHLFYNPSSGAKKKM